MAHAPCRAPIDAPISDNFDCKWPSTSPNTWGQVNIPPCSDMFSMFSHFRLGRSKTCMINRNSTNWRYWSLWFEIEKSKIRKAVFPVTTIAALHTSWMGTLWYFSTWIFHILSPHMDIPNHVKNGPILMAETTATSGRTGRQRFESAWPTWKRTAGMRARQYPRAVQPGPQDNHRFE